MSPFLTLTKIFLEAETLSAKFIELSDTSDIEPFVVAIAVSITILPVPVVIKSISPLIADILEDIKSVSTAFKYTEPFIAVEEIEPPVVLTFK